MNTEVINLGSCIGNFGASAAEKLVDKYCCSKNTPALCSFYERNGFRRVTPDHDDGLVKYLRAL